MASSQLRPRAEQSSPAAQPVTRPRRQGKAVLVLGIDDHPSTRHRVLKYLPDLADAGYSADFFPIRSLGPGVGEVRRARRLVRRADVLIVQRIASAPLSALLDFARVPFIYDVDDAIHFVRPEQQAAAEHPTSRSQRVANAYRRVSRGSEFHSSRYRSVRRMVARARLTIVGNSFLERELAGSARSYILLPTCVSVDDREQKRHSDTTPVRIGWIGVRDNLRELRELEPAFAELRRRYGDRVTLSVVSAEPFRTSTIRTEFIPWDVDTELESIGRFDIAIMPLVDNFYARGKCAFKAIQCMAIGIPAVVSPVGANVELIRNGQNGFLATTEAEWVEALGRLVDDPALRQDMGIQARETIRRSYSSGLAVRALTQALQGV